MRRAAKVDRNQPEIVQALRKAGCFVQTLAAVGQGVPDLMWSRSGRMGLIEVKDGAKPRSARLLTPEQSVWHMQWLGPPVRVVETVEQALEAINEAIG